LRISRSPGITVGKMNFKKKVGLLGATFLTAATFGVATPALAQDDTCPPGTTPASDGSCAEDDESIVVTGSRLRRNPENAPAPLIQLTQEDIIQSGEPNLVDYLADVPALSGSTVPEDTTGAGLNDGGLSLLNLRDLGAVRTLVLIDGRRHVGAPQGGLQVDVDTIPTLLVDNVEIVTGGQSAVYGADAVSGVVNFIMRRDFEGVIVDGSLAQINDGGEESRRISGLFGRNLFNDRLNVYAFGESQEFDEVLDSDMDWRREGWALLNNDSDTAAVLDDGQLDNILIRDARDALLPRGGRVTLANQVLNSPAADPDHQSGSTNPAAINCAAGGFNAATTNINAAGNVNCFNIAPENVGSTWVFQPDGTAVLFDYGTFQDQNGASRRVNVGGDGLNVGTEFGQGSRIPGSEAWRYQFGANFDILPNVQLFAEAKFAYEETYDEAQPTFFQGGIGQSQPGLQNAIFGTTNFNISDDNAFLDPALQAAILANTRAGNASGVGVVADRRATFNFFGPIRTQLNNRELQRYVAGLRGDFDQLLFVNNFEWEVGYTYGRTLNENQERGVDVIRFAMSLDAVEDTLGEAGPAGAIVCRNQLLAAQGFTVDDPLIAGFGASAAMDAAVAACVPQSMFGVDMRIDGYNPAAEHYYNATIKVSHENHQHDWLAYGAGELWDLWGAGPIGLSAGYEYREESTNGVGRSTGTAGRLLFLNTGPDFATAGYDVHEGFAEVSIPLARDLPFMEYAEFSAAYRYGDYSTVGGQEARSYQLQWRPIQDLLLRGTYGESVRVPNLTENFAPATQTFANGLIDPCDINAINNPANAAFQANRIANCAALANLMGDFAAGFTTTFVVGGAGTGVYASGRSGVNAGNPFLQPERGESYTLSIAYRPSWFDDFSVVFDYYDITISEAIAAITAQTAINQCVNGPSLNMNACNVIFRNPAEASGNGNGDPSDDFQLPQTGIGFIQGSLNYASTTASGIDFSANLHIDLGERFNLNWGDVDISLRGNYLISQADFTNIANPNAGVQFATTVGLPRVRTLLTTTWSPIDELRLIWDWDWQAEQEIVDERTILNNPDDRDPSFLTTEAFSQHDFAVAWDATEWASFRAGIVNAFDNEPDRWLGSATTADNFDLFGRRYFVGITLRH
jgi:outer membrane receptor protein involved in Fe transport